MIRDDGEESQIDRYISRYAIKTFKRKRIEYLKLLIA